MIRLPLHGAILLLVVILSSPDASYSLRESADRANFLVGTAVRPSVFSEPAYSATLAREYNLIEPEDAMKWWVVRRDANGFDFREGDEVIRFAQAHGMKVRGHCLAWDHDNPQWLTQGHFTASQLSEILHNHITTVMTHYAGHVFAWDVVNEALNEKGEPKDSLWYNRPGIGFSDKGTGYVEQAFRWAHEADPHALLFYNEAEGEALNRKSDAIYSLVRDFKQRGVPIDGVGLQFNIARLSALGIQVHITELDVSLPVDSSGKALDEDLRQQADAYRRVVHACLQYSGCTAIQTWGFTDKYSWIGSHSHGTRGAALPFDRAYQPKPAYEAILTELSSARHQTH